MSAPLHPDAERAIGLARSGDLDGAIAAVAAARAAQPDDPGLAMFAGVLHMRRDDAPGALPHLRRAAALLPADPLPKFELARALLAAGMLDEAEPAIAALRIEGGGAVEMVRLQAELARRRGRHAEAAALYDRLGAAADAADLAHLGETRLALGDPVGAVAAFGRSLALGDRPEVRLRLADAQVAAGQGETALAELRRRPPDPLGHVLAARIEEQLERTDEAEASLRTALALDRDFVPALLALATLLERTNRLDALDAVLARIAAIGVAPAKTALVRARLLLRRGDLDAALAAASAAPANEDGGGRAQLIGEIEDRRGHRAAAFAAFAEMNRITGAEIADAAGLAAEYRARIARIAAITTPNWYAGWTPTPPDRGRAPVFMFGFPRSGTTLLDTMLMAHRDVQVLEEPEILPTLSQELGSTAALATMDEAAIVAARVRYRQLAAAAGGAANGRLIVDKSPLGGTGATLAHRLFPDARYIFVERHPCDVVLSCFMTRMRPDLAGANFLTLEDIAKLYDAMQQYWVQCKTVLPLNVHDVRYERMIEDVEAELRPLANFLGLSWNADMLDHQRAARDRGYIATPSYAQVAQPIYRRSRGRWEAYREELKPVLPLLAPWAETMGYTL
ncbi:MAG: sulfotransferase [Sphingomonadaceae bacterium]|nr:sulfotransferase [Sphingomonadaceae bacterium]